MSGIRKLVVGGITQGNLKGKALGDALARELNQEQAATTGMKKKLMSPMKKTYGKKK